MYGSPLIKKKKVAVFIPQVHTHVSHRLSVPLARERLDPAQLSLLLGLALPQALGRVLL